MAQKMTFNYFYGNEADQFSFYRIPNPDKPEKYLLNLNVML